MVVCLCCGVLVGFCGEGGVIPHKGGGVFDLTNMNFPKKGERCSNHWINKICIVSYRNGILRGVFDFQIYLVFF